MDDRSLHVLLIEDNPGDAVLIQELLRDARTLRTNVAWVEDLATAGARLACGGIDIVLLDLSLPDSQGLETLRQVVARAAAVPVVVLTGLDNEQLATRALSEGAQDYLVKGQIETPLLERAIRYAIERERSAHALRQNEARFRSLIQHSSDVIMVMDQSGHILFVSPSIERVLGYRAEEQIGTSAFTYVHLEDRVRLEQAFAGACARPGVHAAIEFRLRHADGSWRHLEAIANNLLDDPGVHGVVQTIRDITESHLAEQQRDGFFVLSLDMLCIAGVDGYFKRVNPAWEETLGYSEAELFARPFLDFVHPDDLADTIATVRTLAAGAPAVRFENRYRCKDGSYKWLAWNSAPDAAEGLIFAVAHDVTAHRRAEEELRDRVRQRAAVAELSQQALVDPDLFRLMDATADLIARTLDVDYSKVLERLPDGNLLLRAGSGQRPGLIGQVALGGSNSPSVYALQSREPVVFEDLASETRFTAAPTPEEYGVVSGVSVVIEAGEPPFGVLGVDSQSRRHFSAEEVSFLQTIAKTVASVVARERAEAERARMVRHIQLLLDSTDQGIYGQDHEGNCTFINHAAAAMVGYEPDALRGRTMHKAIHHSRGDGSPYPIEECPLSAAFLKGRGERGEDEVFWRQDGTSFPVEWSSYPIQEGETFHGAVVSFVDISRRRVSEQEIRALTETLEQRVLVRTAQLALVNEELDRRGAELREAKTFLETLIASGPVGMYRADRTSFTPSYMSPNSTAILGYAPEEMVGIPGWFPEHVHPDDRGQLVEDGTALPISRQDDVEYRIRHNDGSFRWLRSAWHAEPDATGNEVTILGYFMDVTAHKEAQEGLQQAKAEAEEANRAKSEFLSRMSHELRTPLNAILGFTELMSLDERSEDDKESITFIEKAGLHLLDLINEVLDIARIEADRLALSMEPVSLSEVLQEVVDLARPLAAQRRIRFPAEKGIGADRWVLADQQRLKQVLLNLLSNAIKYNRESGRVTVRCEERPAERLRILVSDTGSGIPPEKLGRLFSPFDRLDAEQGGVEGTGLGLALSKRLVEAMDGIIGVESQVGQGSTFWIELPLAVTAAEETNQEEAESESKPLALEMNGQTRTLLYIEDNLSNLRLVERALERRPNYRLLSAMQGSIGLEIARQHRPDLILLDLHLPDIGGDAVLQRLRDDPRTQTIPVIMVSADATPRQMERLLAAGAREYLTKPLSVKRFLEEVDSLLQEELV
ncbi:MAG: PAS domain S-box protein [Dehalococcoidia bacterium]